MVPFDLLHVNNAQSVCHTCTHIETAEPLGKQQIDICAAWFPRISMFLFNLCSMFVCLCYWPNTQIICCLPTATATTAIPVDSQNNHQIFAITAYQQRSTQNLCCQFRVALLSQWSLDRLAWNWSFASQWYHEFRVTFIHHHTWTKIDNWISPCRVIRG